MLSIFKRSKKPRFDIAAIGENWLVRPLSHENVQGRLHVRQVPTHVPRKHFPVVALAWIEDVKKVSDIAALGRSVKEALEEQGNCLLVLVHETSERVMWYAYAADAKSFNGPLSSLGEAGVRWGVNEDRDWLEYEHAKGLVGA